MAQFPKTQEALSEFYTSAKYGVGEHIRPQPTTGSMGQILGYKPFDPAQHNLEDIDPLAFGEDESLGEHYVQEVLPEKPFNMTIVQDNTHRQGASVLQGPKIEVIKDIVRSIDRSLVGSTDHAHQEVVEDNDRQLFVDRTRGSLDFGLTFGVSDFHKMDFADGARLDGMVAVKVNHLLEREIPANVGFVSLGGAAELNTNNSRDLIAFNRLLDAKHRQTAERLETLGAKVVPVVVDPRLEHGFAVEQTDSRIADALMDIIK